MDDSIAGLQDGVFSPMLPGAVVDELLFAAARAGMDTGEIKRRAGIGPGASGRNIGLPAYARLARIAQSMLGDEALLYGRDRMPRGSFRVICRGLVRCGTLGEALAHYNEFLGLFMGGAPYRPTGRAIEASLHTPEQAESAFYKIVVVLCVYKLLCWLSGKRLAVHAVELPMPRHPAVRPLRYLFGRTPKFNAAACRIEWEGSIWDEPVIRGSSEIEAFGRQPAWVFLWGQRDRLEERIRAQWARGLAEEAPGFEELARRLDMSPQTLSRQLRREGLSYRTIKDELMAEAAIAWIAKTEYSVEWVARKLGYAEQSSFSRAFKRWTGMRPGEYRRMHQD